MAHRTAWLERGGVAIDAMAPDDGLTAEQRIDRLVAALALLEGMDVEEPLAA